MKKLTGIAICAMLAFGAIVTTFSKVGAVAPLYGVNYGNQLTPRNYRASAVSADLDELKRANVTHIRIATECYDNCGGWLDMTKQVAVAAKQRGFAVIWGVDSSNGALTQQTWQAFLNASPSIVKWCSDNKMDYCEVGNEEDDHVAKGFSPTTLRTMLKAEASTLKNLYPNQKLTYAATQPNIVNWMDAGAFDVVGFNLYGGNDTEFKQGITQAQQNPKAIVTEWNLDQGINSVNGSQTKYASSLVNRRNWLNQANLPNYIFTLRGGANGIDNRWNLWNGSTRTLAWKQLIK